jgi:arylsulfatase A-like enzyme
MISPTGPAGNPEDGSRFRPLDLLVLSACCGLAGGLLEVGARVLVRHLGPADRLYMMSRHFVWLAPLSNLLLFLVLGLCFALVTGLWPRVGGWLCPRLIVFLATLPMLVLLGPAIYPQAWAILALGIAWRSVPLLERNPTALRRKVLFTLPCLLGFALFLAAWMIGGDRLKVLRAAGRPLPSGDAPNILLITLDTVRADHLSLYGYERRTSPTLEWLAGRAIRFEEAHATAPWTLPSHASMFTGRAPRELGVNWDAPLDGRYRTLAEYLGSRGYATAGFVANTISCSYDRGLDRGFTHFEDYILEQLLPLRTAWLPNQALQAIYEVGIFVGRAFNVGPFRPSHESWLSRLFITWKRKDAVAINRAFLDWSAQTRDPKRPFFAFLNYYDAHAPYVLPVGAAHPFGLKPRRPADFMFLIELWEQIDKVKLRPSYRNLARDSYDNCVAYLDRQLAELFTELQRRGELDRTLVIVTSDHGEEFGEHDLFDHGVSLYRPEIHVPLLIMLPARSRSVGLVRETVSLRDLPSTIVDLAGLADGSPFPGASLSSLWRDAPPGTGATRMLGAISELPSPDPLDMNQGRSPAHRGSLVARVEGPFVYIRNEGDGGEELFNHQDDPAEEHNLAGEKSMKAVLERLRRGVDEFEARLGSK